jgi:hypothetical protein
MRRILRMKRKTKKIIYRPVIFGVLTAAAVLAVIACAPSVGPGGSSQGTVDIQLEVDRDPPHVRTLVPGTVNAGVFDKYDLVFTVAAGESGTAQSFTDATSLTASLEPGKYDLALTAKKGGVAAATGEYKNITVTEGAPTPITVPLVFKPGAGDGTLSFTITRPSDFALNDAQFVLTPLHSNGTTYGTNWLAALYNDYGSGIPLAWSSPNEAIASGYYEATVTLSTSERKAVKHDIVHIGAGQTTTLNWIFVNDDFKTSVESIWVVGAMSSWELPGIPMTPAANGTFTWEGEIVTDDPAFRFSLTDTTGWDDVWNGNWFAPSITQTPDTREVVGVGRDISMEFAPTNTAEGAHSATESAWKMNAPGHYRLIVDPYDQTFDIEAWVGVTKVEITGGNITLNKGVSNDFTATVTGINSPSQGVTWSITSGHAAGTAFNENRLTIAADETAASLTIRATSTADTTKYGEITVTVQGADSPVVTRIDVSAPAGTTEASRNGELTFTKTVIVSNGAAETVTWTVGGKDKDGSPIEVKNGTSISNAGVLKIAADEAAVDLVVRATSQQPGYTNIYGEASVFVRKLGSVYLIGDEFGNWTDTGTVELTYAGRGVYTKTVLMSKDKSFRFKDNSSNSNYFEPYPDGQSPSGTVDAWQHLSSDESHTRTAWTGSQGGIYEISLNTVTEKVMFTTITKQAITITGGPSALAPGETGTFTYTTTISETDAPVTWNVYGDGVNGHVPQNGTQISNGTLTLGSDEWIGHKLYVTATSLDETVQSSDYPALGVPVIDPDVYILGTLNNWETAGVLMTRGAANEGHLFTWTGDLSGEKIFRMHIGDGSEWARTWFTPPPTDNGEYGIHSEHHTDIPVVRWENPGDAGNRNWRISWDDGNYTIVFNAAAKTLNVTKNN